MSGLMRLIYDIKHYKILLNILDTATEAMYVAAAQDLLVYLVELNIIDKQTELRWPDGWWLKPAGDYKEMPLDVVK